MIISSCSSVEEGKDKLNKVTSPRISYGIWVLLQEMTILLLTWHKQKQGTPVVSFVLISFFWSSLLPCFHSGDLLRGLVLESFLSFSISDEISAYSCKNLFHLSLFCLDLFFSHCFVLALLPIIQHSCNCWRIFANVEFWSDPIWPFLYSPVVTVLQN